MQQWWKCSKSAIITVFVQRPAPDCTVYSILQSIQSHTNKGLRCTNRFKRSSVTIRSQTNVNVMSSRNNRSLFFTELVKFLLDTTKRKAHATKCRPHIRKQWGEKKLSNGVGSLIRVNVSRRNSLWSPSLSGQLQCYTIALLSSSICLMYVLFCQVFSFSNATFSVLENLLCLSSWVDPAKLK